MMKRRSVYSLGVSLLIGFFVIISISCAPVQPNSTATVSVNPSKGTPGTNVVIKGAGFKAGEEIDVVMILGDGMLIGMGTQKVEAIVADSNGTFEAKSAIPKMAKAGIYTVEVEGNKGGMTSASVEVIKKK
ncbi:MAG: hypothetical protein JSV40_07400 [Deltaproteobacteria bacterium]|nr:MAG: hypothetical protein JSV40_07400 [Deltaproteobacteria bacterium]